MRHSGLVAASVIFSFFFASCSPLSQENLTRTNTNIVKQITIQRTELPQRSDSLRLLVKPNSVKPFELLDITLSSESYVDSIETKLSTVQRTTTKSRPMLGGRSYLEIMLGLVFGASSVPYIAEGVKNSESRAENLFIAGALLGLSYYSFATYFSLADEETTFTTTDTLRIWRSLNNTTPLASQQIQIRSNINGKILNVNLNQDGFATVPLFELTGEKVFSRVQQPLQPAPIEPLPELTGEKVFSQTLGTIETRFGNTPLTLPEEMVEYRAPSQLEQKDLNTLRIVLRQKDKEKPEVEVSYANLSTKFKDILMKYQSSFVERCLQATNEASREDVLPLKIRFGTDEGRLYVLFILNYRGNERLQYYDRRNGLVALDVSLPVRLTQSPLWTLLKKISDDQSIAYQDKWTLSKLEPIVRFAKPNGDYFEMYIQSNGTWYEDVCVYTKKSGTHYAKHASNTKVVGAYKILVFEKAEDDLTGQSTERGYVYDFFGFRQ
jgi:hypothetical protein